MGSTLLVGGQDVVVFRMTVKLIIDIQNRSPRIAEHGVHALLLQALNNNL